MIRMQTFDVIQWINHHSSFPSPYDYNQMRPILCFSLIWNLFETRACSCDANNKTIAKSVRKAHGQDQLQKDAYADFLVFFKNRYVENAQVNRRFYDLIMSDEKARTIIKSVLLGETNSIKDNVHALLLIAYRIRNNLFHGNKDLQELPHQLELFEVVNKLLATYLDAISPALD